MKKCTLLIVLLLCAASLFSCAREPSETNDIMKHKLRMLYKSSSSILKARCMNYAEGNAYAVMNTEQVLYGFNYKSVYCKNSKLEKGRLYMLFLSGTTDQTDKTRFDTDSYTAMEITGNAVRWKNKRYSLTDVEERLKDMNETISTSPYMYFYAKRREMIDDCDVIVIGKLSAATESKELSVYSATEAASTERKLLCHKSEIRVVGTLRGDFKNGDTIDMIYAPDFLSSMIDSETLSTISLSEPDMLDLTTGQYYLFFLCKGTDSKQNYYMPINPIQGWIQLENDRFICAEKNTLFENCSQLNIFVGELSKINNATANKS